MLPKSIKKIINTTREKQLKTVKKILKWLIMKINDHVIKTTISLNDGKDWNNKRNMRDETKRLIKYVPFL